MKYVFILPGILWVLVFTIFPLLYSLRTSFYTSYLGISEQFVGLHNYARAFGDYQFWTALRITLLIVILSVAGTVVLGLLMALLLNQRLRGVKILRGLFTLPLFATPVAIGYLALTIFSEENGPIDGALRAIGAQAIPWLSSPGWALTAVTLIDIWQWTPFCVIVFLAALQGLPEELFEAARLDSSSAWQVFRSITLPLIAPTIVTITILRIVETFKIVDIPFSLTGGGPGIATRTYSFLVYVVGLRFNDAGYASALAYLLLILVLAVASLYFARLRRLLD
jgi:multiple sugar transport system permease protein